MKEMFAHIRNHQGRLKSKETGEYEIESEQQGCEVHKRMNISEFSGKRVHGKPYSCRVTLIYA